ncbi:kinase-like protein [Gigaspora margarita]|uniref:Kinase-like protein n=1 Tax=Gigaspora margarita TaxID=4874 RepID=A0A8H4AAW3_GIGMA|nr:kinase-like protein [Gigaspora margarita]
MTNTLEELIEKATSDKELNYIEYNKFTYHEVLGTGNSGEVTKYEWNDSELTVALKRLKVNSNSDIEINYELINELKLLQSFISNKNIITFYGVTKDNDGYFNMVLQYADNGNLREYLSKNFINLEWNDKLHIAKEIACGLSFLHENNIIHRNLHSKNILIDKGEPLIADFGLAKQFSSNLNSHEILSYIEPQCLIDQTYKFDKKSDVYSLGVILWEISSGKIPFQSIPEHSIADHISQGNREESMEGTPSQYIELYKQCWDKDPNIRPETNSILETLNKLTLNGTSDQPISNESLDQPINNESLDQPIINESLDQPISNESLDQPINNESLDQPITYESLDQPISNESLDQPISNESLDQPISNESLDQPISNESLDQPISNESLDQPISNESLDQPISNESLDQPISYESLDQPISNESLDQPISNETDETLNQSVSEETLNKSISEETSNQINQTLIKNNEISPSDFYESDKKGVIIQVNSEIIIQNKETSSEIIEVSIKAEENLEIKRKKANKYFNDGKFVESLKIYEEILMVHHSEEDLQNASNWNLYGRFLTPKWKIFNWISNSKKLCNLIKALDMNTTLTHLNLWGNEIGPAKGKLFAEALKNHLGPNAEKMFTKARSLNTKLTLLQ